ncbi:hypothetical protein CUJ88_49755 (plasmid) [Paraburkholderia hospita]|nr:hypothetical protein CUJ88_49755 [Paraburkholderia hospita]
MTGADMGTEEDLQVRAYYLWEAAGRPDGQADRHWALAQQESATQANALRGGNASITLIANDLPGIFASDNLALLERRILPGYLVQQRWFAAKGRSITSLRVVTPTIAIGSGVLSQIEVTIEGDTERYALPMTVVWDDDGLTNDDLQRARDMAIATVRADHRAGFLTDAFFVPDFVRNLLAAAMNGADVGSSGDAKLEVVVESGVAEAGAQDVSSGSQDIRWLSAEQSNSSVIVDGHAIMKLMRRLQPGVHPEAEMCRFLTQIGYTNASPLLAEIVHLDAQGTPRTVLVIESFLPNQGDAWARATASLRDVLDNDGGAGADQFVTLMRRIGRRLGELHAALSKGDGPAFAAEAAQPQHVQEWKSAAVAQLDQAIDVLRRALAVSSLADAPAVRGLIDHRAAIVSAIENATMDIPKGARTRIHGDFHLGQVLCTEEDVYVIDFEGEPARPIDARRVKSSPLRDVAGLLRSIAYAAAYAAKQQATADAADANPDAQLPAAREAAERSFLEAYAHATGLDPLAPVDQAAVSLLSLFLVEKAAYEVCYEGANRPDWIAIPAEGLARALDAFAIRVA